MRRALSALLPVLLLIFPLIADANDDSDADGIPDSIDNCTLVIKSFPAKPSKLISTGP